MSIKVVFRTREKPQRQTVVIVAVVELLSHV